MALAAGTVAWQHLALFGARGSLWAHAPYLLVDLLLALPVAAIAVGPVSAAGNRIRSPATMTAAAIAIAIAIEAPRFLCMSPPDCLG